MRIAWIGLGTMGAPMAGHLLAAGHELHVHNRTRAREEPLAAAGAVRAAESRRGGQRSRPRLHVRLRLARPRGGRARRARHRRRHAPGRRARRLLDGLARHLEDDRRARCSPLGLGAVDAPVSGGSEGARNGTLTVFVGGEVSPVQSALPALQVFARSVTHLGLPGAGQAGKAVNQVLIAGTYAALGEGLALAEREGLPLPELVAALGGGAARSWILENRSKNVIENDYPLGFRVALHLKDLKIALAEADRHGLPMAVTRLVAEQEERLVAAGHGDEDNSVLARVAKGEVS